MRSIEPITSYFFNIHMSVMYAQHNQMVIAQSNACGLPKATTDALVFVILSTKFPHPHLTAAAQRSKSKLENNYMF